MKPSKERKREEAIDDVLFEIAEHIQEIGIYRTYRDPEGRTLDLKDWVRLRLNNY